jgi:hypothetical protein
MRLLPFGRMQRAEMPGKRNGFEPPCIGNASVNQRYYSARSARRGT